MSKIIRPMGNIITRVTIEVDDRQQMGVTGTVFDRGQELPMTPQQTSLFLLGVVQQTLLAVFGNLFTGGKGPLNGEEANHNN